VADAGPIPEDIRAFIVRYLTNIEHLEVFALLQRSRDRYWSASEVAAELRIPAAMSERVLEWLASNNFLDIKILNDVVYRFDPATSDLGAIANRCAALYQTERIAMINLIMSALSDPIRNFADAFRLKLKKDRTNG
jgi:hypothetical protein